MIGPSVVGERIDRVAGHIPAPSSQKPALKAGCPQQVCPSRNMDGHPLVLQNVNHRLGGIRKQGVQQTGNKQIHFFHSAYLKSGKGKSEKS